MNTPSEILNRAADLIRDTAAEANPGPWRQHDTHLNSGGHTATVMRGEGNDVALVAWLPTWNHEPWDNSRQSFTTARWIALMSPEVAPAAEILLREAAANCARAAAEGWSDADMRAEASADMKAAFALAAAVLGIPEETT